MIPQEKRKGLLKRCESFTFSLLRLNKDWFSDSQYNPLIPLENSYCGIPQKTETNLERVDFLGKKFIHSIFCFPKFHLLFWAGMGML